MTEDSVEDDVSPEREMTKTKKKQAHQVTSTLGMPQLSIQKGAIVLCMYVHMHVHAHIHTNTHTKLTVNIKKKK